MKQFTFTYTDHVGRTNRASRFAEDVETATQKFKTLYPISTILKVE